MAAEGTKSPLRRLREYYDEAEPTCPACGYVDQATGWTGRTDGQQVSYRHKCPSCGAVQERELDVCRD
ncbi:HVO_0649 family zinc finger protein [Halosegnis sp.]|uniref:HVO_0649 family zinc finger protein n=1 Tax=Halosegnis sp. TaxID=2864959 RepID=UPI0035D3F721